MGFNQLASSSSGKTLEATYCQLLRPFQMYSMLSHVFKKGKMITSFEFRNVIGNAKGQVSPQSLIHGSRKGSNGLNRCIPLTTRSFQNTIKGEEILPTLLMISLMISFYSHLSFLWMILLSFFLSSLSKYAIINSPPFSCLFWGRVLHAPVMASFCRRKFA